MFLIHDDEAYVGERGEDPDPGTDGNAGLPAPKPVPFVIPFPESEPAVEYGDFLFSEPADQSPDDLIRQCDFRHQNDDGPAFL